MTQFTLDDLAALVDSRAGQPPDSSYTAKLLAEGPAKAAKKLGEEAVEAAIAAVQGDRKALVSEAADVLYHLLVTLKAGGVPLSDVMAELQRRTAQSGLAEKAARRPARDRGASLPIGSSPATSGPNCAPTRR
jgi:phosphoribosyl-ATP pyrophosphohydrolase